MIEVRDASERTRYEIFVDGTFAGFTDYRPYEATLVFEHTEIEEQFAGQGLASTIVRAALDDVRSQGGRIVPLCEYMAGWLTKHADYDDLVDRDLLARLQAST